MYVPRAKRRIQLPALFAGAALLLSCTGSPPKPQNVVLIVIDTLRFDHLACYGGERHTSPAIDALASESTRFARAYATAPWTIPSVASILTGRYPSSHGAVQLDSSLPEEAETLADIFRRNEYDTAAVISHMLLARAHGFAQGSRLFGEVFGRDVHNFVSTEKVTDHALGFLQQLAEQERPFFLFVHYFDPHYNYLRHPEYGFAPDSVGRLRGGEDLEELRKIEGDLTPEEYAFLGDIYDEEIRFTDAGVGRLLDRLRQLGLYDQTLIIVTADHGEEFGDHRGLGHSRTLYEEVLRVPLILRLPGGQQNRPVVETPVSLVSIAPTILDLTGIAADSLVFQGESLVPLLSASARRPRLVFFEVSFDEMNAYKKGILLDGLKIIQDERTGKTELYDVRADPHELLDLTLARPDIVRELLPIVEHQSALARDAGLTPETSPLSEGDVMRLRSLGYIR